MKSENVLSWNVPNLISVWLMLSLLWVMLGVGSHLIFRKGGKGNLTATGVGTAANGNIVTG